MDGFMVVAFHMMSSTFALVLQTAGLLFVTVLLLYKHRRFQSNHRLPPSPRAFPIIGHFHLLSDKNKPVHRILDSLSNIYGPAMGLKFGSRSVLVISSSDLAKQCFTTNDLALASRLQNIQGKYLGCDYTMLGWAPYGPYWRIVRKICVLELLSAKRIHSFRTKRMREIFRAIKSLYKDAMSKNIVNMRPFLKQLTFKIVMSMTVDDRYFGEESGISAAEVTRLIEESFVFSGVIDIGDYIPWLKWLDLQGHEKAMKKTQQNIDLHMQRIVDQHGKNRLKEGQKEEMDFVDVLISQAENNDEIVDKNAFVKSIATNMLSAGTDSSAVALEWALSELLRNPSVMEKTQQELDSKVGKERLVEESDIPHLKYLQAIMKETLRLHPPGPIIGPHRSIEDCTIGGFHVPSGTVVMVNAWAIQRDPKLWRDSLEFKPERFMEREVELDNIFLKGNEFQMMPFGAGRRGCPAVYMAMQSMQIILARLLQCFDWGVADETTVDMTEGLGMTMRRAVPLNATLHPRLPQPLYQTSIFEGE